ncbi:MAG TPA: NUDIX domain-containing protein [Gemmatimonadaceae bacterium]|nr:NUDIX domain-containing protein [Gemmatimonadaceae bacterium]
MRLFSDAEPAARRAAIAVDLVPVTPMHDELAVLLVRAADPRARERWMLPWDAPAEGEALDDAAARVCREALGAEARHLEQVAAFGDGRRHPGDAELSVGFAALVPLGVVGVPGVEAEWHPVSVLPPLPPRHQAVVESTVQSLCARVDVSPLAFRLLPTTFTLTELQTVYEMLLGRRLHKASFRRTLEAAKLVVPTEDWRTEGRGRPAQLFRFAPRRRRRVRRALRFDLL